MLVSDEAYFPSPMISTCYDGFKGRWRGKTASLNYLFMCTCHWLSGELKQLKRAPISLHCSQKEVEQPLAQLSCSQKIVEQPLAQHCSQKTVEQPLAQLSCSPPSAVDTRPEISCSEISTEKSDSSASNDDVTTAVQASYRLKNTVYKLEC